MEIFWGIIATAIIWGIALSIKWWKTPKISASNQPTKDTNQINYEKPAKKSIMELTKQRWKEWRKRPENRSVNRL